jgi:hypothetical protein
MDSSATLLWGLFFGSVGLGYVSYGKRRKNLVSLACGLLLIIYPYFFSDVYLVVGIGAALMALPYYFRL